MRKLTFTLNGPAAYTSSLMQDSDQSYTNVATVNVSGNIGDITINAGVETLTITDGVTVTVSAAADDLLLQLLIWLLILSLH